MVGARQSEGSDEDARDGWSNKAIGSSLVEDDLAGVAGSAGQADCLATLAARTTFFCHHCMVDPAAVADAASERRCDDTPSVPARHSVHPTAPADAGEADAALTYAAPARPPRRPPLAALKAVGCARSPLHSASRYDHSAQHWREPCPRAAPVPRARDDVPLCADSLCTARQYVDCLLMIGKAHLEINAIPVSLPPAFQRVFAIMAFDMLPSSAAVTAHNVRVVVLD